MITNNTILDAESNGYCHKPDNIFMETIAKALDVDFTDVYKLIGTIIVAGITITVFLWGYVIFDKRKVESQMVSKINELQKQLILETKQNELLSSQQGEKIEDDQEVVSTEELEGFRAEIEELQSAKFTLEEQVQTLEKELENSTEVGLELNRMLQDILNSQNGSDTLISNIEQLQRQLVEQQATINTINENLSLKDTENHELKLELEVRNKKLVDLQEEYVKIVSTLSEAEEDKEQNQGKLQSEISDLKAKLSNINGQLKLEKEKYIDEIKLLKKQCKEAQRSYEVKVNEYNLLKDGVKNTDKIDKIVDLSSLRAEVLQLQRDNKALAEHIQQEEEVKVELVKKTENAERQMEGYKEKYDVADREKLEAQTKLEVLSNYFTEKEKEMQRYVYIYYF